MRKVRLPLGPAVIDVVGPVLTDEDRARLERRGERDQGPHKHELKAKAKARAKTRAQRQARKAHRKGRKARR
jgi:hypothetical protein